MLCTAGKRTFEGARWCSSLRALQNVQQAPQIGDRQADTGFHGAQGNVEQLRNACMGLLFVVGQTQHLRLFGRQAAQGRAQAILLALRVQPLVGRRPSGEPGGSRCA